MLDKPGLHSGTWARKETPDEGANKELQKGLFISSTKYFLYHKLMLSQNRSLKIEPDTMLCFGFPYLVFITPQLSSRKGNETEDDRMAFPEVKPCSHHGLFTVSVTMLNRLTTSGKTQGLSWVQMSDKQLLSGRKMFRLV